MINTEIDKAIRTEWKLAGLHDDSSGDSNSYMIKIEKNGNVLYCAGRSGSKSISMFILGYSYFPIYCDINNPDRLKIFTNVGSIQNTAGQVVLIVRNPKERFLSGIAFWESDEKVANMPAYNNYKYFMSYHGAPILHKIDMEVDFKIIPFETITVNIFNSNCDVLNR